MKKVSSVVWQFFDRLEENKRCVAVLCKLCDSEYKYFGNTTNLRAHLIKKHPLQWEFRQNNLDGSKEESSTRSYEGEESNTHPAQPKKIKYARATQKNVDILEQSEAEDPAEEEDLATINLVRQMHENQGSDEEWLEEDFVQLNVYEPPRKKPYRKVIKREVVTPPRRTARYIAHPAKRQTSENIPEPVYSKKDEYSVFGEYIANKLRKFEAPRTRGNIQQVISTILWQAEYGMYDDAEAVKRILMASSIEYQEAEQQESAQEHIVHIPPENYSSEKGNNETNDESNQTGEAESETSDSVVLMA